VGNLLRFGPSVGGMPGSPKGVMLESVEGLGDIPWHGDVNGSVGVVRTNGHCEVQGSSPIHCDDIEVLEGCEEMSGIAEVSLFDSKVIYYEAKCDIACRGSKGIGCDYMVRINVARGGQLVDCRLGYRPGEGRTCRG
jgi:hypothetical protein